MNSILAKKALFFDIHGARCYTPQVITSGQIVTRSNNGGYDPLDRLKMLRQVVFDDSYFEQSASSWIAEPGSFDEGVLRLY